MTQTADELKTSLKNATKAVSGKPYFFAMVFKGSTEGALIVDKRKIASKLIDAAKKEFNTTTVVKGVCFGDEGTLVFETPRPPPGTLNSIAKRLAQTQCGLTIKPEFKAGRDDEQVPDEDESEQSQGEEQPSQEALARKAYEGLLARQQPQLRQARESRSQALTKIEGLLHFAAEKASGGDHRAAVQALQTLQGLLDNPPPLTTPQPVAPTKSVEPPVDEQSVAFNSRFALLTAKLKKAAEDKLPSAGKAKAVALQAAALAQKKEFEGAIALLLEAEKLLAARPSTTSRDRGPTEPEAAREFLAQLDPSEEEDTVVEATANLLDDMKKKLTSTKRMVTVDDLDALAEAMARENGISKSQAATMIANNQGRGFTGKSGIVYVLGNTPQARHDEVHETVHLMSAPGGATQIMAKYGEQLNEALTEFFTKQMCKKLNVPDAVAYPEHVAFMNKLAPVVGYDMLYAAYMKNGGFDPVINKLTDIWIKKSDTLPGPQKPPNVKGVINRDKAVTAMDNKFLNNFPPGDAAMKFWNMVFFA